MINKTATFADVCISLQDDTMVFVKRLKFNTLRLDTYWVNDSKLTKVFKSRGPAEIYYERLCKKFSNTP